VLTRDPIQKLKGLFMIVGLSVFMLLSGCAYPNELRKENQANPGEFITVVQQAVDQFHAKTDVLPIKNSDMSTPLYEKYVIDFSKLQKSHYLSSIPMNAFESGGVFIYVLVNVETKPEVKLIDLAAYQSAVDVQKKVEEYQSKHSGEFPYGEKISPGFYYVDFKKLGMKEPVVKSAYNRQNFVNYLIHEGSGRIAIDYGQDLMKLIQTKSLQGSLKPAQDLRELLVASSYFIPARSFAYHWSGGQPIPVNE
jgi:hypothetical protein